MAVASWAALHLPPSCAQLTQRSSSCCQPYPPKLQASHSARTSQAGRLSQRCDRLSMIALVALVSDRSSAPVKQDGRAGDDGEDSGVGRHAAGAHILDINQAVEDVGHRNGGSGAALPPAAQARSGGGRGGKRSGTRWNKVGWLRTAPRGGRQGTRRLAVLRVLIAARVHAVMRRCAPVPEVPGAAPAAELVGARQQR